MALSRVLIANRGEIARRIIRTCHGMGLGTVAVYSEADADAPFVREADEAVCVGPAAAADSYLVVERILEAAARTGADAVHPGYGFLSENAAFAQACEDAGLAFIGPSAETIAVMGSKAEAKRLMTAHGVPVVPGLADVPQDTESLARAAHDVGFPVLVKASAGGGGKGMRVVRDASGLEAAIDAARREATSAFGDGTLLIERYIDRPRHVEVQILGDAHGNLIHLFERECSIQRRHQKIIEETPSPALTPALRASMTEAAVAAGRALGYRSAGTVEFILAPDGAFYFLEVNTRLQVEHPVTEAVTGLDLVALQLGVADGEVLPLSQEDVRTEGHAIECRLYAEDADAGFLPATGRVLDWHTPAVPGLRVDSGIESGSEVSVHYDPMLAKIITWGATRVEATRRMSRALRGSAALGVTTNRAFLARVLDHPAWAAGDLHTHFIEQHLSEPEGVDPKVARRAATAVTVAITRSRAAAADRPLPGLSRGWRNSRWRDAEETWQAGDVTLEVRHRWTGPDTLRVTDAEGANPVVVRVVDLEGPRWRLELDGHQRTMRLARDGERWWVQDGPHTTALTRRSRFPVAVVEEAAGSCVAPMPGKVLRVLVAPGDEVEAGAPLLILEAMKMEHTLAAPRPGRVAELLCVEGNQVEADATLVVLAEDAPVE